MKHLLISILFVCAWPVLSKAQCAVYGCEETGSWEAGFNVDGTPTSMQECKDYALQKCKENGGKDCKLIRESNTAGWYAFISGAKDGRVYFQGVGGGTTKKEAEDGVRKLYKDGGGTNPETVRVTSWYVYYKPK